jgi:hypothetical protein
MAKGDYGHNCYIGSPGYGRRKVRVLEFERDVAIISTSENEGRRRRNYFAAMVTQSGFEITVGFVSYEERGRFNRWLSGYMEAVVDGTAPNGYVTVAIPYYDFAQTCVPESDLDYGEGYKDGLYTTRMKFKGASDPLDLDLSARMAGISYFQMPTDNVTSKYFYPAGRQVSGAESLEGTIFDATVMPGISGPDTDRGLAETGF